MRKHQKIIKELGRFLLLLVLASAVAVTQGTSGEFIDTVVAFGNDSVWTSNEVDTAICENKNGETSQISVEVMETTSVEDGDGINPAEDTDSGDSNAIDDPNPDIMPPDPIPEELMHEEQDVYEWWEQILFRIISEDMELSPL